MKEIVLKNMNITTDSRASDILKFEFEPITTCYIYDGFELGNLSINGSLASVSSSDLLGRGAMMIFTPFGRLARRSSHISTRYETTII